MSDFAAHLVEIAELINGGIDPVPLYEMKMAGAEGWSDPEELGDLVDPGAVYRKKPKTITIGTQKFEVPTYINGTRYWAVNVRSPNNPAQSTYTPANAALKYQADCGLLMATKKQAIDMAKAIGYWLSQGGSK